MRLALWAGCLLLVGGPAFAQQLDLTRGGPIAITSSNGIEWRQAQQEVIARGNAQATRGDVTVTGDQLIAWYRKKAGSGAASAGAGAGQNGVAQTGAVQTGTSQAGSTQNGAKPGAARPAGAANTGPATADQAGSGIGLAGDTDTSGNEIYRVQAEGNVHIYTQTDQAWGDRATYDLNQGLMVMTGRNLKLTTPNDVLTARDDLEYWAQKHMAVARGDAVVVTKDARRLSADTLVAYTADSAPARSSSPAASRTDDPTATSGKLQKVEAFGHVTIRTPTDTVTGERAVYVPDTGIARIGGNVRITRGQNQLNGSEAEVNMKTGISRLLSSSAGRVQGLVVPNDKTNPNLGSDSAVLGGSKAAAGAPAGTPAVNTGGRR